MSYGWLAVGVGMISTYMPTIKAPINAAMHQLDTSTDVWRAVVRLTISNDGMSPGYVCARELLVVKEAQISSSRICLRRLRHHLHDAWEPLECTRTSSVQLRERRGGRNKFGQVKEFLQAK